MRTDSDLNSLAGTKKAAMLMMAIGDDTAAQLFSLMEEDEIRELSQHMANLGTASSDVIEDLLVDFADQISSTGAVVGNCHNTERMLLKVLQSDQVDDIMEEIRGPAGRTMWDQLANVNERVLADYLKNEYPQTVAVVLTKIDPGHAARVLSLLPEAFAMNVVSRMLKMEAVKKEVLEDVERTLRTEFMSTLAKTSRRDPHELMAEIFNHMDRTLEGRFLDSLEEHSLDSAERIKALMFTFDDLSKLNPGAAQTLLGEADNDRVCLALKGASEHLRDFFFSNMSERAGKMMKEDLQAMGPVRLRDVDDAQGYMINLAKELAAKGDIVIADGRGDDKLVY
jgi:flagellar motor switch protein FliG